MSLFKTVNKDITLCINCVDTDLTGVIQSLTSVWTGNVLPKYIILNFNQPIINIASYHLERTIDLFKINDVVVSILLTPKNCIKKARQDCLDAVSTEWAWFVDDDTLPFPKALHNFLELKNELSVIDSLTYIFGTHVYATNPGNIPGFTLAEHDFETATPKWHLWNYSPSTTSTLRYTERYIVDTGNIFLHVPRVITSGFKFFDSNTDILDKTSGEDTLFGLYMLEHGYHGYFSPDIESVHLLKPMSNFGYDDAIVSYIQSKISGYSEATRKYYQHYLRGKYKI